MTPSVPNESEHELPVLLYFGSDETVEKPDSSKPDKVSMHSSAEGDNLEEAAGDSETLEEIESSDTAPVLRRSSGVTRKQGLWRKLELAVASCSKALIGTIKPSSYSSVVNLHNASICKPGIKKKLE